MSLGDPRPHVVIVGGFLTEPLMYRRMAARLRERGAERVTVAPLHLPDWLAMGLAGLRPSMLRAARTIREARRASPEPLLVVGHSAGGILSRLAMSAEPFDGRLAGVAEDVGGLVTLGTPHLLHDMTLAWRHPGVRATEFLLRASPGAHFAPRTGYLTVASTLVPAGEPAPTHLVRRAVNRIMHLLVGRSLGAPGDGIVSDALCRLEGARHLALPAVLHGVFGGPWYGDGEIIDDWWPAAIEVWRAALDARAAEVATPGQPAPPAG